MPPKAPTLKFKPKLVIRPQPSPSTADPDTAADAVDDLSLVQLERRQRQQQQQQQESVAPTPAVPLPTSTPSESPSPRTNTSSATLRGRVGVRSRVRVTEPGVAPSAFYPDTAPTLPVDTMNRLVLDDTSDEDGTVAHRRRHAPIALDPDLPARLREQCDDGATTQDVVTSKDGTAFLREWDAETARAYAANRHFYDTTLAVPTDPASTLVWLQLPRPSSTDVINLHTLPPGRVGELRVMRSGRMVLQMAGVEYEVAVEEEVVRGVGTRRDGASTVAVATLPGAEATEQPGCYELGVVERKLICTPVLDGLVHGSRVESGRT